MFTSRNTLKRLCLFAALASILQAGILEAAPIIPVGNISLFAGTSGQVVPIRVEGNVLVQGLNLNLSVEGGGPTFDPNRSQGPRITNVDVTNATIFGNNNTGQSVIANTNQAWAVSTTTNFGTVSTNGILAWVTFDTRGIADGSGPYEFTLTDPLGVVTDFAGVPATVGVGHLFIAGVPEPSACCLLGLGSLALMCRRRHGGSK